MWGAPEAGHHDQVRPAGDEEAPAGQKRGGRPSGATRERILDVALELFTERGYDKTSLREIADELGFTKAALYYHFEHKEDILLALHLRLHALGRDTLARLDQVDNGEGSVEDWSAILDRLIEEVLSNRKLFLLHARNHHALEQLEHVEHVEHNRAEHEDLQHALQRFLAHRAIPTTLRVRMACSIGAVMTTLVGAADAFDDVPDEDLARYVRDAVRDLLGVVGGPMRRGSETRRTRSHRSSRR